MIREGSSAALADDWTVGSVDLKPQVDTVNVTEMGLNRDLQGPM